MSTETHRDAVEKLSQLFGSYKAEWLRESMFELFSEPTYFPELTTRRPCVLIGGRGSGKTTVLRCLSYEGRHALAGNSEIDEWTYYGFYHRVNTNRVTAFKSGNEGEIGEWRRLFSHYVNLLLCAEVVNFLVWHAGTMSHCDQLSKRSCQRIARTLCVREANTIFDLRDGIEESCDEFESYINNIGSETPPKLSMQGAPVDIIFDELVKLPHFSDKAFFFLIDEYENFLDYQQIIMNSLIKHSGKNYTFKLGVRELGWRVRETHNPNEFLTSPADYVRIDISERLSDNVFSQFARDVCSARFKKLEEMGVKIAGDVDVMLPSLSDDQEAELLGVDVIADEVRHEVRGSDIHLKAIEGMTPLQVYFIKYWSDGHGCSCIDVIDEYIASGKLFHDRYSEYKFASLFTIRRKRSGIVKYFCGFDVYVALASKNIRYFLELVDQSLLFSLREGGSLLKPVSPRVQTAAAQYVGKKNLSELEGLSVHGAQLTKLLLGLGRIFGVMASKSEGHAPEVNQFKLNRRYSVEEDSASVRVEGLIKAAIMHLALVSFPGNKLKDEGETRDKAFQPHPIFAPYFVFSHKKGVDFKLEDSDIIGLVETPRSTIKKILRANNRDDDEYIPEQLHLFEGYYNAGS